MTRYKEALAALIQREKDLEAELAEVRRELAAVVVVPIKARRGGGTAAVLDALPNTVAAIKAKTGMSSAAAHTVINRLKRRGQVVNDEGVWRLSDAPGEAES